MKFQVLALFAALAVANADHVHPHLNRRQDTTSSTSSTTSSTTSTSSTSSTSDSASSPAAGTSTTSTVAPAGTTTTTSSGAPVPPGSSTSSTSIPPMTTTAAAAGTAIPPLSEISSAMATRTALLPTNTYTAGAKPSFAGAPGLPTPFVFSAAEWPTWDRVPPTDSTEVQAWMKELDGHDIPDLTPTVDGSCGGDPAAAAAAADRGWWTCGGHTRSTDIVACPDKLTWGVSFDDGPSPFTQYLINYLEEKQLSATFFVVGSRVVERPTILVEEYMKGHEISVHTWSHRPLTSLTTEQVVAELGWTRKAIKKVLGVTPTTMRPPFGDIDDRVRAISLAMGMIPIMWSRTPVGGVFDTNDWRVAAGYVKGPESFQTFQNILGNATQMDTGFIVLQHDLYEATVDLGVGYTIPYALDFTPKLNLVPIGQCVKKPTSDLYLESNTNTTFPPKIAQGVDTDGDGTVDTKSGDGGSTAASSNGAGSTVDVAFAFGSSLFAVVAAVAAGLI
ncbi:carbohydrate esterase family 4 protein [Ephemerocybe angulata]|uniref:chitin deacetylase n=1 Tax=Ephemerocybe angulata TaxID=980116 RepID=A0A8H6IBT0_9AGAR|nr:carbohydrate esterase family 4 protein [Tulosesus angulatus]